MTNPFKAHGIEHLSPSSCNRYAAAPAMFVLEKVLKNSSSVGAGAHRGTAVEAGIAAGLDDLSASTDHCIEIAMQRFAELTALSGDHRVDKEREAIPGFVATGLAELRPYGKPTAVQGKVSIEVPGLAVPIIGFFDFEWEHSGVIVDLKTTHQCPSKISTAHARQVSLYRKVRGHEDPRISYVTGKRAATYRLENADEHFSALVNIAFTIQRFLSLSEDPQFLASLVSPDPDSFYYSDPITRDKSFKQWGI